jgi:hypothetical protein
MMVLYMVYDIIASTSTDQVKRVDRDRQLDRQPVSPRKPRERVFSSVHTNIRPMSRSRFPASTMGVSSQ